MRSHPHRMPIDIKIDEGASTKITDIQFEGNEHYSDRKLRKFVNSRL